MYLFIFLFLLNWRCLMFFVSFMCFWNNFVLADALSPNIKLGHIFQSTVTPLPQTTQTRYSVLNRYPSVVSDSTNQSPVTVGQTQTFAPDKQSDSQQAMQSLNQSFHSITNNLFGSPTMSNTVRSARPRPKPIIEGSG